MIGSYVFHGCTGLTSLVIPHSVTTIGACAFKGYTWLVVATLPVTLLGQREFAECTHLSLVVAPPTLLAARGDNFVDCPLLGESGFVPDSVVARRRAFGLRYWSWQTHWLCSPSRRAWVQTVLLVSMRLRQKEPVLPNEMWYAVLECIPRWALGPAP